MRSKTILPAGVLFAVAFAAAPLENHSKVIGPGGGGGNFLPTMSPHDPNCVLVSCDMTGAYISHDKGRSWRMFNLGDRVGFFLFDPVDPKVIYAKTISGPPAMASDRPASTPALFRSEDLGQTWNVVRADSAQNGPGGALTALAVDPSDSQVLYAAFGQGPSSVLSVSVDRGLTWKNVAGLPNGGNRILIDAHSPREHRTIYVAGADSVWVRDGNGGRTGATLHDLSGVSGGFPAAGGKPILYGLSRDAVFVSEDGGQVWRPSVLPTSSGALVPAAVATSLHHPEVAYVSYSNHRQGKDAAYGVAKTTDRGRTWTLVWKESLTSAPNIRDSWMSERFGPGWGGNPIDLGVAPGDPNLCFGTDYGRTMRTTDGGRTWDGVYSAKQPDGSYSSTGLDVTTNYGVHFDPFDARRIFISYTDIGLFRSENGGRSWTSSTAGVPEPWVNTTYWITFDPKVRGRVWGAMSAVHDLPRPKMWMGGASIADFDGGVCRSEDGGRIWKRSGEGMPPAAVTHVLLDPDSPPGARVLYAAALGRGVYKSTDGGSHWSLKNGGIAGKEPFAWRVVRDANGTLYLVVARRSYDGGIGGDGDGALYRSTDGAEHWVRMKLPEGANGPHGLAVDPRDPRRLYLADWERRGKGVAAGGGVFLSTDGGATWREALREVRHVYDVTIDPRDPKVVYACGFESSAWRSSDRGETWRQIPGYDFKWGHRVIPDPVDPQKIYITTYGGGVWVNR